MSAENELNDPADGVADPENKPRDVDVVETQLVKAGDGSVCVALDAMGGDNAPTAIIDGAILALNSIDGIKVALVGDEKVLLPELAKRSFDKNALTTHHAGEVVGMDESPSAALRKKRDSSIHVGIKMLKEKQVDAFISAGNTGAVMAVATVILKTLEGIDRAAIAAPLPTRTRNIVLLDAGANVSCKAAQLYQFGVMGAMYAEYVLEDDNPKVGLLSIGEEDSKGNDVTKETFELLTKSSLNFVGNVEAKLLYRGLADVVVCDGFTGNIALKISESLAELIGAYLKEMFAGSMRGKLAYSLLRPYLDEFKKKVDHSEVGGAPLLGIDGAVFIAHGSSTAKSIHSALCGARKFVIKDINGHIRENLARNSGIMDSKELKQDSGLWDQVKRKMGFSSIDNEEL